MAHTTLTRDLLARMLAGDFDAERRLFEHHRAVLLEKARRHPSLRRLRHRVAAEDVVQEVFWRALSARLFARFEDRGRGSLEALLTTLLECTLVDALRRSGAQKRGAFQSIRSLELVEDQARVGDPVAPSSEVTTDDLLQFCRSQLRTQEWVIWRAVELTGRDTESIGREWGLTPSAVRSHLFRARQKLITALGRE